MYISLLLAHVQSLNAENKMDKDERKIKVKVEFEGIN